MAQRDYKPFLEKWLIRFLLEDDPIKAMLEWLLVELMQIEGEAKVGTPRVKHSKERKTYFSGRRVRRLERRVGTIYLVVRKVRKGGYVPFFVVERKRSKAALLSLVEEAFVNRFQEEDRAASEEFKDRGSLSFAGIGDNQKVR